ncbi:ABC-2 family transporter protein [Planctomycetes bacterium MalM25]|nr:ABC-2 family transporter protein [Planctomycetes bacterium MalM25]
MNARIWGVIAGAISGGCLLLAVISPTSAPYLSNLIGAALLAPVLWWLSFIGLPAAIRQDPAAWANLLWKEWREHRWKLAALTAIYLTTYAICLYTTEGEGPFENAFMVLMFVTPLAALFIGMGLAGKERGDGTAGFLRVQPVTLRYAAIAKLVLGMLTLITPVLLTLALAMLLSGLGLFDSTSDDYPFDHWNLYGPTRPQVALFLLPAAACGSLLIWFAVLGMNQSSELRAGVVALVAVIALWVVSGSIIQATRPRPHDYQLQPYSAYEQAYRPHRFIRLTIAPALPGGIAAYALDATHQRQDRTALMWSALSVFAGMHGLLIWRWVTGYGKNVNAAKQRVHESTATATSQWLGPPSPSPLQAILWKQVRECLPIIGGVIALAAAYVIILDDQWDLKIKVWAVLWVTSVSGFLAALLVGVASFQDDLSSGLSGFWRSRPIDPDLWFWTKYSCGFSLLAIVFGTVYMLSQVLYPYVLTEDWISAPQAVLAFWTVYSSAVCVACLVRNVIYAGILSFAVAAYTTWLALVPYNGEQLPVAVQVLILTSVSVGLTLLAWQAMRRDWALRLA